MIMARGLKVRLRVLIPAVENSIAGSSFRPRDIYTSRKGITVEIGNTDAEGRLVLADALALADEDKPELIADFATLTGAARVALGPDLPAFFTDDDALADELMRAWPRRERSVVAAAAVAALRGDARIQGRRHQQCRRQPGRRHHRGAVHAPLRDGEVLAAFRSVRLDRRGEARPAGRRRVAVGARALRACWRRATGERRCPASIRASPRPAPISRRHRSKARLRPRNMSKAKSTKLSQRRRRCGSAPRPDAPLDTEALMGERVTIYEWNEEGWAWGQLASDNYVGWLPQSALGPPGAPPTHKVVALRSFAFPGPSIKLPPLEALPFGARLVVAQSEGRMAVTAAGAYVPAAASGAGRRQRDRFCRRGRALPRRALSVGRQDRARAWTAPAWCRSRSPPAASRVRATAICRNGRWDR